MPWPNSLFTINLLAGMDVIPSWLLPYYVRVSYVDYDEFDYC